MFVHKSSTGHWMQKMSSEHLQEGLAAKPCGSNPFWNEWWTPGTWQLLVVTYKMFWTICLWSQEFAMIEELNKTIQFSKKWKRAAHQPIACCVNLCFSSLLPAVSKVLHPKQIKHFCELLRLFKHTEPNKTLLLSHRTASILINFPSLKLSDGTSVSHIKSKQNRACIWCDGKLQGTWGPCHRGCVLPEFVLVSDCGQELFCSVFL